MSKSTKFSPVVTQKACGIIYDQIRSMIVAGDLSPGDKLPSERALMSMMQRSRPDTDNSGGRRGCAGTLPCFDSAAAGEHYGPAVHLL